MTFEQVWEQVTSASSVNFYTHKSPDGDSISSCVGLHLLLQEQHPSIDSQVIILDKPQGKLATCYLQEFYTFEDRTAQVNVYPDTSIKVTQAKVKETSVCIDHHKQRQVFATYDYAKIWPSCAGLIYNELDSLDISISANVAKALLVGAITDTGRGLFGNKKDRKLATLDILALDNLCDANSRNFSNSILGLTDEQEDWAYNVKPLIKNKGGIATVVVPPEYVQSKSTAFLRSTLQEFMSMQEAEYLLWTYPIVENGVPTNNNIYSMRGVDVLEFGKPRNAGGHQDACSLARVHTNSRLIKKFRKFAQSKLIEK